MEKERGRIIFLSIILVIFIIQFLPSLPPPAKAQSGSILYSYSQTFTIGTFLNGIILDSNGERIYTTLDQAPYVALVALSDSMIVMSNVTYSDSSPGSRIITESTYIVSGISGSYVGLDPSVTVTLVTDGNRYTMVAIDQNLVVGRDNRYAYFDGTNVYVLGSEETDSGATYLTLWSNQESSGNSGTQVYTWHDTYLEDGYMVSSFAYDSSTGHLYIAYIADSYPAYFNVVIVDYDTGSGSSSEIYHVNDAVSYPRRLLIYNGVLYGLLYASRDQGGYIMLFIYDPDNQVATTIQLFSDPPNLGIGEVYDELIKPINGKIIGVADLLVGNEDDWIIGISEYDPATGTVTELGHVNLTEILGMNAEEGSSYYRDIAMGSNGYYRLGLATSGPDSMGSGYALSSFIIECNPSSGGGGGGGWQPPSQQSIYQLERMYTWGGDKAYRFLDFHFLNETAGYLTATSRIVDKDTETIDNTSAGIAVVLINYDSDTENVLADLLIDKNYLLNATGSFYTGNETNLVLFYGYKFVNGYHNATVVAWNATSNETVAYLYSDYKSISEKALYIEYNSTGNVTLAWLLFIAWNGTMLNASFDESGNLDLQPVTPSLPGLGVWDFNDTSGLVKACPVPGVNATIIVTLEKDTENSNTVIRIYNLTRSQDLTLTDVTPAGLPAFPLLLSEGDAEISDIFCTEDKILININYNVNGTSYIILVNKTDDSVYQIFKNASVTLYKYSGYSYAPTLGASYLPDGATLRVGIVYSIDTTTGGISELAILSTNANEEVGMAVTLGTMMLTYGISYHSPSNLTISGVSVKATPVPEYDILVVLPIIAVMIYLLATRYRLK